MSKAKFTLNNSKGALHCSNCLTIIKEGDQFTDEEWKAMRGDIELPRQYCDHCKPADQKEEDKKSKKPEEPKGVSPQKVRGVSEIFNF